MSDAGRPAGRCGAAEEADIAQLTLSLLSCAEVDNLRCLGCVPLPVPTLLLSALLPSYRQLLGVLTRLFMGRASNTSCCFKPGLVANASKSVSPVRERQSISRELSSLASDSQTQCSS